jgi:hypothetical protein
MLMIEAAPAVRAASETISITPVSLVIVILTVAVGVAAATKKLTILEILIVGPLFLLIGSTDFGTTVRDALNGLAG